MVSPNQMPAKPISSISLARAMTCAADGEEPSGLTKGKDIPSLKSASNI
jgi:hypothetical protein